MESVSNIMATISSIQTSTLPTLTSTSTALSKYNVTNVTSCLTPKSVSLSTISNLLQRFLKPALVHHQAEEKEKQVNTETNQLPNNRCHKSQQRFSKPASVQAEET